MLEILSFLAPPYCIGLVFGFIYLVLFVELDSIESYLPTKHHFNLFIFLAFLFMFTYAMFLNSFFGSPHHSSFETNWIYNMSMATFCFLSALYFFGFLSFSKVTFKRLPNFRSLGILKAIRLLFFNFHFFLA